MPVGLTPNNSLAKKGHLDGSAAFDADYLSRLALAGKEVLQSAPVVSPDCPPT